MWWMVGIEVEILVIVGAFSIDFDSNRHLFLDDQNVQERNHTVWLYFHGELNGRP
jgi:hypothetical protein